TQLLIGIYLLGYVGFIRHENIQIEGFFFYLFSGVFAGATLHYFIAKIVGPLIFGRGWCAWACWTAMILDFLPWKQPAARIKHLGAIRYLHFLLSLGIVSYFWFFLGTKDLFNNETTAVRWLAIGNVTYYVVAIVLAFLFKDNRAFCKYVCPVPVFQKLTSRFSLLKMSIDSSKCIDCGLCEKNCPMGIELLRYKNEGKRILSTECILCTTCQDVCPKNAIKVTFGFDRDIRKEYLRYRE
ncbi:4Fe-4S dicluster domain-containing protein, partial [candidate division WOR-3 bacterium]|nr:4Fe-4S dicluster domain-containing protein [candidate division WOR-3 bacterium]